MRSAVALTVMLCLVSWSALGQPKQASDPEVPLKPSVAPKDRPRAATALGGFGTILVGRTAHVSVYAATSLGQPAVNTAKVLLKNNLIEIYYSRVRDLWKAKYPTALQVSLTIGSMWKDAAGTHSFGGTNIQYSTGPFLPANAFRPNYVAAIFVAELEEIFSEHCTPSLHWSDVCDGGEACSRWIAESFVSRTDKNDPASGAPNFSTVYAWYNAGCPDFASRSTTNYMHPGGVDYHIAVGGNLCALHYMRTVCKFSTQQIINAGDTSPAPMLENVFRKLTGRTGVHKEMVAVLRKRYPGVKTMASGILNDNLFDSAAE